MFATHTQFDSNVNCWSNDSHETVYLFSCVICMKYKLLFMARFRIDLNLVLDLTIK